MKKYILLIWIFILIISNIFAHQFEVITVSKEFSNLKQNCYSLDSQNNIYIGTDNGLLVYKDKKWKLITLTIQSDPLKRIFIDSKDRVWCITEGKEKDIIYGELYMIDKDLSLIHI